MSGKVIIASDSTCDLSKDIISDFDVQILPLGVTLGDKQYTDGVDVTADDIYAHYNKTGELPKTAAVNIAKFEDFFKQCTDNGDQVVLFTISSQMSSTYHNAELAAEELDDVHVVDTANLSTGGGLLVLAACKMARQGKNAAEIADACRKLVPYIDASFVIDNLEFLYKGGRCSALERFGANLLQLKPCIVVKNGTMGVGKKYRGRFGDVLKTYVADRIGDASDIELDEIFVTHAGCDMDIVNACVEQVKAAAPFKKVYITRAGCTISSHCGKNTLGVLFIRKSEI